MFGYRACPDCGAAVHRAVLEADQHCCAYERWLDHQVLLGRRGLARLEQDLEWWLGTPQGRFQLYLAIRDA